MNRLTFFVIALSMLATTLAWGQQTLIEEYFNYPDATVLNTIGYSIGSGAGVNVVSTSSPGLTYSGYAGSGFGNCVSLTTNGEDVVRNIMPYDTSGSVYLAALVNVSAAQATGDMFLSFHYNNTFNGKVFAKKDAGTGFYFGSGKNTGVYESTSRTFNTTYLVVVKYTFNTGSTTDDRIDFWVNPALDGTEPAATGSFANITDGARTDYVAISGFVLRQGSASNAPTVKVGGIRMATDWATAVAPGYTWNGSVSTDYQNAANWTPSRSVATNKDVLFFNTGTSLSLTNLPTETIGGLMIDNSTTLDLGASTLTIGGTLTLASGTLSNTTNNVTLANGATIVMSGGVFSVAPNYTTSVNLLYSKTTAQTTSVEIPSSSTVLGNLTIHNNAGVTLGGATTVNGMLVLTTSADLTTGGNLTLADGATIMRQNAGNVSAAPTFGSSVNLIYNNFFGSQTFTTGAEVPSSSSVLNNVYAFGAVTLGGTMTMNGTLTLASGKVTLGSYNLTVGSVSGTSSSKYMNASGTGVYNQIVTGTGAFIMPVGDATNYTPANINVTAGSFSSASFGVKVSVGKHGSNTSTTDYLNRSWTVTNTGITGLSYGPTFTYVAGDVAGTEANLYGGAYNGSVWLAASVVNTGTHSFTGTGFSAPSLDFTAGELSAMPVEMASFTASMQGASSVLLTWLTATEINNNGFEIERRLENCSAWTKIGFVFGAGTSYSPREYTFQDLNLSPGVYVYRIKQIDNDGTFKYSASTQVDVGVSQGLELLSNYPNPFNPETNIRFSVPENGYASLKVFNMLGQEVATLFSGIAQAGHYISMTFNGSRFASGVYFSRLQYDGKSIVQRMLMTK